MPFLIVTLRSIATLIDSSYEKVNTCIFWHNHILCHMWRTKCVSAEGTLLKVIHGGGDIYIALEALTKDRAQKKDVGFVSVIYPNVRSEKWITTFWFNRPLVCELEYHDLGEKESFMGLWTSDEIKLNGKTMFEYTEIRITEDAANFLIDFINGDTPLTDNSHLKVRVVKTPALRKTEYHEPMHY